MALQFSPYAIPLFLAATITGLLAWYALRRRRQAETLIFGLLMIAQTLCSLFYALNMSGANLETSYLFNRLKYIGALTVPPLWFILALQYAHHDAILTRRNLILIFLPAMVAFPIVMTNPLTEWWWIGVHMGEFNGFPALLSEGTTTLYKANLIILYLYVAAGLWLYIRFYQRAARIYRSQAMLMVIAGVIPLTANIITQGIRDSLPWGLESFLFTLSGGLAAIAIFRYRFLDIVPVARHAIVEQMPEGIIVTDARGRIVDVNPAAQAMIGARASVTGQPLAEATHIPELRQALLGITRNEEEQPGKRDVSLGTGDGDRVLTLTTTPLLHRTADPIGQIILLRDISERVAAQRELEALYQQAELERQRLALTIRTATDAIALLDTEGRVLASNPPARQIFQAQDSDRFPPSVQEFLRGIETGHGVTKAEIEIGEQSFHITAAPVAGTGLVLTLHDVSHFRRLARMKDEFVATVSHDLRSPLNIVLGNVEVAQEKDMPEEERRNALKRARRTIYHMAALINDLLDLAKIESGIPLNPAQVEMDKLAREVAEDLKGIAAAKGIAIQYDLSRHPPIRADRQLITRVWHNLIDNAIKYTEEGAITVRVKALENQIMGQVMDTGIGIASLDLPYVFDKFFRASHQKAREAAGTGLGLALAKSIVEKHHGQIWAESELNAGSTFTFTLPL